MNNPPWAVRVGPPLLAWVLGSEELAGQTYSFRNFGAEAGVAVANAVALDGEGTLVVGTNDGLVRFDGSRFERIALPARTRARVVRLAAAPDGAVWILTDDADLFRLDAAGEIVRFVMPVALARDLDEFRSWNRLRVDGGGRIWVNGSSRGLWGLDPATSRWVELDPAPGEVIVDFFIDGESALWLASRERVGRVPLDRDSATRSWWNEGLPPIAFVQPHSPGRAWVGTAGGAYLLDERGEARRILDPDYAAWWHAEPSVDPSGRLLFAAGYSRGASRRLGVMRLGVSGDIEFPVGPDPGLHGHTPRQLLFGAEGDFWLAHEGGLIYVEQDYLLRFPVMAPDGTAEIAKQLVEDARTGMLWVSTWGGMYRLRNERIERVSELPRRATTHAALASDGTAWWMEHDDFGFEFGAGGLRNTNGLAEHVVFEARDGSRYVARKDGFYRRTGGALVRLSARRFIAAPVAEGRGARIWISPAFRGVDTIEVDSLAGECRACGSPSIRAVVDALRDIEVVEMRADGNGRVWIAAGRSGLICLYASGAEAWTARRMTIADGLLSDEVHSVFPTRDGRVWVGTPRGLQAFRVLGEEPVLEALFEFRAHDGMSGEYVSTVLEDATGLVWFGSSAGQLHRLDYRRVPVLSSPSVRLARMKAGGEPRLAGREPIRIRSGQGWIEIDLAPRSYRQISRLLFEYRLLPVDTAWTPMDASHSVRIASLAPGRHTFEARAVRAGQPPGPHAQQDFIAVAPFYRTWWFQGLAIGAFLLPLALWYHLRTSRRLAVERLRIRIAGDLHDDLGSGLTQISLYSELIRRASRSDVAAWAERVGDQARALSDAMRDIVWAIAPEHESWDALELRMKDYGAVLLAPHGVAFDMSGSAVRRPDSLSAEVRRNVLLLFKEALNNSIRHAHCRRVTVRWRLSARNLRLLIADDGRGFDPVRITAGHGLSNLRRRAEEMGASVRLETAPGGGTSVELNIPL